MSDTYREVERKLRVHALFRLPDLNDALSLVASVERQEPLTLTAVYHDTEDLRLFRWGITLRRREGGHDAGWHLKLPVEGFGLGVRDEVRVPLDHGVDGAVPWELADLVTALTREHPLTAVATLRNVRVPHLLRDHDGRILAELVDDTVSVLDGEHVAARFREIEVEVVGDDLEASAAVLSEVVDLLVDLGAVPGTSSKAAHALGPRASAPPDLVPPGPVSPKDPAADAVRAHLATHVRRFLLQDVRVRRDLPDAVHQMRVAARRLRSGLHAFGPLVDPEWAAALRTELGWAASELGAIRDTEVLLGRLDAHAARLAPDDAALACEAVDRVLRERLTHAREEALEALRSQRHRDLLVALVQAAHAPLLTDAAQAPARDVLPALVDKAWRRLRRDVRGLRLDGPSTDWHETRIAAKKARYAVEAVVPVFGAPAKALAEQLSMVTEVLGEHQDAAIAQDTVREIAGHDGIDGRTGFALGLLHGVEVEAEHRARLQFVKAWPRVRKVHQRTRLG